MSEEIDDIKPKKKTKKIKKDNYLEDSIIENDNNNKVKRKKSRKKSYNKKTIQIDINENNSEEDETKKKPKKKKKSKKKKKQIETEEEDYKNKKNLKNDSIDDLYNLTEIKDYDNFSEKDDSEEQKAIKTKKKKRKKKTEKLNQLEIENELKMMSKTPRAKTAKIKINDLDEKKKKKNSIEKEKSNTKKRTSKNKNKLVIDLKNLGKKIDLKNKEQIELTKSSLTKLFSKKTIVEKETDYEKDKNKSNINEEDIENEDKKSISNSFGDFLIKIDNSKYKGYNYTIKKEDYFQRKENDKPIMTILNSEDAAIKKCEEIMKSLGDNEKWLDPDFGPQSKDNGKGNKKSILGDKGSEKILGFSLDNIAWYSINEINDNATFFYDGIESNDVIQGKLSNCWFISALSVIATKDYLLRGEFNENILNDGKIDEEEIKMMSEGIYPPIFHTFSIKGIYCFRFFKNLKWRYVIIDDRLPCERINNPNQPKKLIFGRCRLDNEFWVPLIEKAYAKMHGSYIDINSGFIDDGLVDMTGLVSKKILGNKELQTETKKIEEFWNLLKEYSSIKFDNDIYTQSGKKVTSKYYTRNKSMMGCSVKGIGRESQVVIQGHKVGILVGHAYSILDVFEIPKAKSKKSRRASRLLRLRNPWGYVEWNGKWCDNSEEIIKNKKRIENALQKKYADTDEKIDFSKDDGTFLMRYSDFRKVFNNFFFCQNFPPNYIGVRFYDQWTIENSGGIPQSNTQQEFEDLMKNPQYYINKRKKGKLIINLLQEDSRLIGFKPAEFNKKVCVTLFKTKDEKRKNTFNDIVKMSLVIQRRDLYFEAMLDKGEYIVMPSIYNKGDCFPFIIEFYFDDELSSNTKNNQFDFNQLKYTTIKRLGENIKYELINEYIASEAKLVSKNKLDFIISSFKSSLKNIKNEKNKEQKTNGINFNNSHEEESFNEY